MDTELFSTHESESSEYWDNAEVQALGVVGTCTCTEEGGQGCPGGPGEELADDLHEELLLSSPDVAHNALQLGLF